MQIVSRLPVVDVDGTLVTIVVGQAGARFGDEVTLEAVVSKRTYASLYVASVDTTPVNAIAPDVLQLFDLASIDALHDLLTRRYGTGLPLDVPVTIYTLVDGPVEEGEFSEEDQ